MTYPIIRWNGGGGGALPSAPPTVRLGDAFLAVPFLVTNEMTAATVAASVQDRLRREADATGTDETTSSGPSDATLARCRCVLSLAGDLPADLAASALESCAASPDSFIGSLEARGLDVSACAGGVAAPVWRSPWVLGGAAALVLGGLAYVALR